VTQKEIWKQWLAGIIAMLVVLVASDAFAFDLEGKYVLVDPPQPTQTPDAIEVVDVFWYGCGHCWRFLPLMEAYVETQPQGVSIRRLPAVSRKSWEVHARAFYTAQQLGIEAKLHRPIFEAIHIDKQKLDTSETVMALFVSHGVAEDAFTKAWDSAAVEVLIGRSLQQQAKYGVEGTPSVIVNGKFRTSATLAGSYEDLRRVIEVLVEMER
jgi:thiol:disulfide interchange protein DsbA